MNLRKRKSFDDLHCQKLAKREATKAPLNDAGGSGFVKDEPNLDESCADLFGTLPMAQQTSDGDIKNVARNADGAMPIQASDAPDNEQAITLLSLNDLVLEEMLSYLSLCERIKLERVCQRFRELLQRLRLSSLSTVKMNRYFNPKRINCKYDIMNGVLKRIGPSVRSLSFKDALCPKFGFDNLKRGDLGTVLSHCPNLHELILAGVPFESETTIGVLKKASKLDSLDLSNCRVNASENLLFDLFRKLPLLKKLVLQNTEIKGSCLVGLPATLEFIDLRNSVAVLSANLNLFISQHQHLKEFYLDGRCAGNVTKGLANVCAPMLTHLDLSMDIIAIAPELVAQYPDVPGHLQYIARLTKLKSLVLSFNTFLRDTAFVAICDSCVALENLAIDSTVLSKEALKRICNLKALKKINLGFVRNVDDELLIMIGGAFSKSLAKITLCGCVGIGNVGISSLQMCRNLSFINVAACSVSSAALAELVDSIVSHNSNHKVETIGPQTATPTIYLD